MADVEFGNLRKRGDLLRGHKIQAVSGMNFEAGIFRKRRAADDALEFRSRGVGIARA